MRVEQKKLSVVRFYEQVVNRGDSAVAAKIVSEALLLPDNPRGYMNGPKGVLEFVDEVKGGFPDCYTTVVSLMESDDDIIATIQTTGSHIGSYKGLAPSRRVIKLESNVKFKFEEDLITAFFVLHPNDPNQLSIGFLPTLEQAISG